MAVNLPQAYSKILDKGFTLKSLTAPAFKGKYDVVGGTTKTFKVYSVNGQELKDYSTRKSANSSGTFGYEYKDVENAEQVITATQDKYFAIHIDKADAKFANGLLDASEVMRVQIEEKIIPTMDKYFLDKLAKGGTTKTKAQVTGATTAYDFFSKLMVEQTNALVPASGRVAFVSADFFSELKTDPKFAVPSELTANSRRSGNYGMIDGCKIIEVPTSYLPADYLMILTHEAAAAAPKHLVDYKQGESQERASGYYVNGRVVYEAFVFDKKKTGVFALKSK